ncbi:Txe/YoeB family addiction module toxin [Erythrobacter donghaensis]|uniref:Txe/YoeB family addiction module toxin n=1 Tax=Erythrobacter donghaensis TaxID=267135 RepID=UPI0009BDF2E3|nr:Txe/YoeB family addiction module toxin [Erythrobacter donghaensis]
MKVTFTSNAWDEYRWWADGERKPFERLNTLIEQCRRTPFTGTGKPEPLRGDLQGWWSRRINSEDRLVYRVCGKGRDQTLEILQCRSHYL